MYPNRRYSIITIAAFYFCFHLKQPFQQDPKDIQAEAQLFCISVFCYFMNQSTTLERYNSKLIQIMALYSSSYSNKTSIKKKMQTQHHYILANISIPV